jgi:phosphonopyruvate decarboxylase
MINPVFLYNELKRRGTDFFTGVPDSLLKSFCAYITNNAGEGSHIIAVNEGAAVALAGGAYLATGKIPLVYMQNSGLGNSVNPLLSLADRAVYGIPLILLIGWRGEPGVHDEPQHIKQGEVTLPLLDAMGIPYLVMARDESALVSQIDECYARLAKEKAPFVFVVRKDTFAPCALKKDETDVPEMTREEAIEEIVLASGPDDVFFSTTGMASRELYELREKREQRHDRDFLTVGSMGHCVSLALGAALFKPGLRVHCIDGDGALLMHMGALAAVGERKPANFVHILLNNSAHDSVGGQPTIAPAVDIPAVARACGYAGVRRVRTKEELRGTLNAGSLSGPVFIEVTVKKGARKDLGRPASTPRENKRAIMKVFGSLTEDGHD